MKKFKKIQISSAITLYMMMHENRYTGMLRTMMMAVNPEKKERTIKGDRCDLAKDPPMVKSMFSLGHKDGK